MAKETTLPRAAPAAGGGRGSADLKVKAAWLYFVEGLTQEQIARHLDVSRLKVLRMLAACNEEGIVKISIQGETAAQVALERRLETLFGLQECVVVPSATAEDQVPRLLGYAAGQFIGEAVSDGMTVGVGWGATLHESLGFISRRNTSNVSVVSLLGSLVRSQWINPSVFAWRMAEAFDAESFQLSSPVYVSAAALRDRLWEEPQLRELRDRARRLDLALVGVGDVSDVSTIFRNAILPAQERESLERAGAVADVLAQFVDADGRLVDHPINRRVMAIDLDIIRSTPRVVIVAGSRRKATAIRAALRATGASTLITDADGADALLALGA